MKILDKNQEVYLVELTNNGKSLTEYMLESRKNKQQSSITNEIPSKEIIQPIVSKPITPTVESKPIIPTIEPIPRTFNEIRPTSLPVVNEIKRFVESISNTTLPPQPTVNATKSPAVINTATKPLSWNEQNNDSNLNDNLTLMITEQRRQNRLLEQVIAAINTSNALLAQLVQR